MGPRNAGLEARFDVMFANFAKTGNPGIAGVDWKPYTVEGRETMVVGRDGSLSIVNDPERRRREIMQPVYKTYFKNKISFADENAAQ